MFERKLEFSSEGLDPVAKFTIFERSEGVEERLDHSGIEEDHNHLE